LESGSVLPAWAEALADPLPATTFRLLALDDRHRAAHPLGAAVSAVVRERVARHLGCASLVRTAEQDLAAVPASERNADAEAIAGAFATAMAAAPQAIPDDVYLRAEQRFGAAGVVALVHSVAYANFQSRLLHGLGLADGAAAKHLPLAADAAPPDVPAPERPAAANPTTTSLAPANWSAGVAADMRTRMERQQRATPRLPLPADEQLTVQHPATAGHILLCARRQKSACCVRRLRAHVAMPDNHENTVPDEILEQIAREHLAIPTLTTRRADRLDLHDTAVWQLREALAAAYGAGAESTRAR
jgi:hypothetical protein